MKRILTWSGLVLVALSVLVWRAPASLVAAALPPEISRAMQLHELTGTLWQGRALFSVTSIPPSLALAWACRPSLSPLGVRCVLSESASALLTFDLLANAVHAERVTAQVPIQLSAVGIAQAGSPNLVVNFPEILVGKNRVDITGGLRASEATYRLGGDDLALGELTVECAPATDAASANSAIGAKASRGSNCTLSNRGGGARVDGKISISSSNAGGTLALTPANGPTQRITF